MRILFFLFLIICLSAPARAEMRILVRDTGGRVDWGAHGLIAFDKLDANGWFQVFTMKPDGTQQKCLTCGEGFSRLHNGNPAWHPSGAYIVYQSLDDRIKLPPWGGMYRLYTGPGAGTNNNIHIVTADGKRHWRMTDLGKGKGVLHPHFSPDGKYLLWAEMTGTKPMPTGQWVMRLAEFSVGKDRPRLSNIRTLSPGKMQFYETHSFSPDGGAILFTGLKKDKKGKHFDIYKYTLADGALATLTDTRREIWDEHAQFSPDGAKILWMSSEDNNATQKGIFVHTDWWLMDADGGNKRRLTFFNKKGHKDYIAGKTIAADVSWSPDGREAVGYLEDNPTMKKPGHIVKFTVEQP